MSDQNDPLSFPSPPRTMTDAEGRDIELRELTPENKEHLVEMYLAFSPEDRAQGIPPIDEKDTRKWLDIVIGDGNFNILAWHEGRVVGHAMLVGDGDEDYELAIFVLQAYQGAGIGTEVLRTVLGLGQQTGIDRVWLSVERWNSPAVNLYEKIGFETTKNTNFELEMALEFD